jgi:nickel/cobalt exporter
MAAVIGMRHAAGHRIGLAVLAGPAPYLSSIVIGCIGLYIGFHGWLGLSGRF